MNKNISNELEELYLNNPSVGELLDKLRNNKKLLYELIETRNLSIVNSKNETINDLMKVRNILKNEMLDKIISLARMEDSVYILGHNNPDCDSMFSSFLLKEILVSLGINAHFCILDKNYDLADCDKKIVEEYIPEYPEVISDVTNKKFILVDHNTLDGIPKNNVIGAFDHHRISYQVDNLIEMEYASTGLLLYELFKQRFTFLCPNKLLVALTVFTDTNYLCSTRYKEDDELLFNDLNLSINVKYFRKNFFQITDFSKGIDNVINNNKKEYDYNGTNITRILIDSYNKQYNDYYNEYLSYISNLNGNYLLIWCNYEDMSTHVYYNDKTYEYDKIMSSTYLVLNDLECKKKTLK